MTNHTTSHDLNLLHGRCVAGLATLEDLDSRAIDTVSRQLSVKSIERRLSMGARVTLIRDVLPLSDAQEVNTHLRLARRALDQLSELRQGIERDLRWRAATHQLRAARSR